MEIKPKLIIGLGNPEKEYEKTYHNVGFLMSDYLVENGQIPNVQLLKSDVFMNESGAFVKRALKKYKIMPHGLLVIHDDNDIELGKYKISFGRNSAGHKGVDSVIKSLKTKDFWRLRIGIGKTAKKTKAANIVLKKIGKGDMQILFGVFKQISDSLCQK